MTDDVAARKTYRYVRIGMIGAAVFLLASLGLEHSKAPDCWQKSISAYYYTPARSVFVGALIAIGLSLIVIKGNTSREDISLNLAGMLAPVVALVPTSGEGHCWSIPPNPLPTLDNGKTFESWVRANIDNNISALLIAGFFGLAVAGLLALIAMLIGKRRGEPRRLSDAWTGPHRGTFIGLAFTAVILIWATFAVRSGGLKKEAHFAAAIGMFAMLALAAEFNARECRLNNRRWYYRLYRGVAVSMMATAALFLWPDWRHRVLWIELIEILLFTAFWGLQTRELWHNTLRSPPGGSPPPPDRTLATTRA
jgi:hypothetical protein